MIRKKLLNKIIPFVFFIATFLITFNLCSADSEIIQFPETGHLYKRFDSNMNWNDAASYCEILGGHLVTINSYNEDYFVFNNFVYQQSWAWLGGSDSETESVWKWSTGETFWNNGTTGVYSNWHPHEPNNCCPFPICDIDPCTPEHYLVYSDTDTFSWNDIPDGSHSFICEWDYRTALIDVNPDTINLKAKGNYVTCYIELPEEYDASMINKESVQIVKINNTELTSPLSIVGPSKINDYNNNGLSDLMVKFDRESFQDELSGLVGEVANIILYCLTYEGDSFMGSDTVLIIKKGEDHFSEAHDSVNY